MLTRVRTASLSCAVAVAVTVAFSVVAPSAQAAPLPARPVAPVARPDVGKLAVSLGSQLGTRSAGSYLDKTTGKLVVTLTDSSAAEVVRRAGAIPRMVTRSGAALKAATDALYRSARIPGVAWGIDAASDQVLISVDSSVTGAKLVRLKAVVAKLGGAARINSYGGKLRPLDMLDGTAIFSHGAGRCSLGFNVFPIGGGEHYFLTAGHCTQLDSTWYSGSSLGGTILTGLLGTTDTFGPGVYGPGGDYGIVHYEGSNIHAYGTVAGTSQFIGTWGTAIDGENIQRSGAATGVRSGTVIATNVTANFLDGSTVTTVFGLIETNACGEPGDSGGPLYAQTVGLGLTSGGMGNCSTGGMTVFQPIAPIMQAYNFRVWDTAQP